MKKHKWIVFFLLLFFFACNDDSLNFEPSAEGLKLDFKPIAGGSMMYYTLPNNSDIFGINIRYTNSQGKEILKTCGYGGDSLLLDGFTRGQESVQAKVSFVNQRNEESKVLGYQFKTLDSAPWSFFDGIEVNSSWNGFQVNYKSPSVATGMAHVFYLGINPQTQSEDTILVRSFPINRNGGSEKFVTQQGKPMYTVIIRTEDFLGYRVRQEIYQDVDAFLTEKFPMSPENFNFSLSVENPIAKTGVQYLFDGEVKGLERLRASYGEHPILRPYTEEYFTYMAGPYAFGKPIMLDLKEQKTPAWLRLYSLCPIPGSHPSSSKQVLGTIWRAYYEDKIPCALKVYGSKESSDPDSGEWDYLGELAEKPKSPSSNRWSYPVTVTAAFMRTEEELANREPIFVDVVFPPINKTYRYLKVIVSDTYRKTTNSETIFNTQQYFTLHELEVYVKKN